MRRYTRLQEAVDAWREAGAEGFVMRHQQQDGGNSFLMFPERYPSYPMNVGQLLMSGYCLHHVFIAGQPRCCHVDLERLRRPTDTPASDMAELRLVHLAVCDALNNGENAQFHFCNRQGGPKLSFHLNYPGLVLRDEVAERRAMHRVYELLQERGAPLLPDMQIYRREGKHGLLRAAGTAKPGDPASALHCTVPWTNHDPTLVPDNATLLERGRFPPLPDETPFAEDAELRRFVCPREIVWAFGSTDLRGCYPFGISEHTFLLMPVLASPKALREWQYDHARPNNWYHLFRAIRYCELGTQRWTFHHWYEQYIQLRPTDGVDDNRRSKYHDRWERVMQGPAPTHYTMAMLRRLFRNLPRWCPFGDERCELYCSVHITRGRDVMLRCLSCQRARLLGPLDCMQHMQLFSKQYVAQAFVDDDRLPRTLCINAPMGTGKTAFLRDTLRNHPRWSCMGITCRRTLASFLVEQLRLRSYEMVKRAGQDAYVQFFQNASERHPARLAIQLESLRSLRQHFKRAGVPLPRLDLLVLDEYQSLMQQFMSETMAHRHRESFEMLQWFVTTAERVVVLDADLMCSGAPWEQLQLWRSAEPLKLYLNLRLPSPRKRFHLMEYQAAMDQLQRDVRDNEHQLALVATSKLELKAVQRLLGETTLLHSSGSYTSESQPEEMEEVTRCNEHWPNLQMVCFSPTITVGVSYEGAARRVYLLLGDSSCTPETALQMVGRFRASTEVYVVVLPRTRRWHRALPLTAEQVLTAGDQVLQQYVEETRALDMDTGLFTLQEQDPLTRLLAYGRAQQNCNQMMEQRFRRLIFLHGDELQDDRPAPLKEHRAEDERPQEVKEKRQELQRMHWDELLDRCGMPEARERQDVALVMGEGVTRGLSARDVAYAHEQLLPLVLWRLVNEDVPEWQLEARAELCARGLLYDQRAMELPAYEVLDALQLSKEPLVVARHWVALARLIRASLRPLEEVRGRDYVLLSELRTAVTEEEYKNEVIRRWLEPGMARQAQQLGLGSRMLERVDDARWTGKYFECLFRAIGMGWQVERPRTARQREEPRFYMDGERYAYHHALWQGEAAHVYEGDEPPLPLSVAHLY